MKTITPEAIEQQVKRKIDAVGLGGELRKEVSQFLDFENRLFVELVVRDGTKLVEFDKLMKSVKTEAGDQLDYIVRADWEVFTVQDPVQAYSRETGAPRTAVQFSAILKAGEAKSVVAVDVTYMAAEKLKQVGRGSLAQEKDMVRDYLRLQLSKGGESYWDPVRFPHLEINEAAVSYLVGHGIVKALNNEAQI